MSHLLPGYCCFLWQPSAASCSFSPQPAEAPLDLPPRDPQAQAGRV